jgi:hypothetical protein
MNFLSRLLVFSLAFILAGCTHQAGTDSPPGQTVSPTTAGKAAFLQMPTLETPVGPASNPVNDPSTTLRAPLKSSPAVVFAAPSSLVGTPAWTATATLTVTATLTPTTGVGMPTASKPLSSLNGATATPLGSSLLRRDERGNDPCT